MATTDKTTLKNWFKNKLKPTQEHFWAWMDSYWHKEEAIPTSKVENLDAILNSKATTSELANLSNQVASELNGMGQQIVLLADDVAGLYDIDDHAIHDNIANEISPIAEKVSPADNDVLLIEDSENAGVKKSLKIGNLPANQTAPLSSWAAAAVSYNRTLITSKSIDEIFKPNVIVNEEMNVFTNDPTTPITLTAIDTVNKTVTLSWLPYIPEIWNPRPGKNWIVGIGIGTEPSIYGQDQAYVRITGGDYATKTLTYDISRNTASFTVGAYTYLYNIFHGKDFNFGLSGHLIPTAAGTYYSQMTGAGGIFKHSDGTYRLVMNGYDGTNWQVGVFKSVNLVNWTPLYEGLPKFTFTPGTWRPDGIHITSVIKNPVEDGYIGYCYGQGGTPFAMMIGWVKFDEDFTHIEYSPDELIDRTGTESGYYDPNIIFYNGMYRLMVAERGPEVNGWFINEYTSKSPFGPWENKQTDIFDSNTLSPSGGLWRNNKENYRSARSTESCYFTVNGNLYAIICGISNWNRSANRGERQYGIVAFDDKSETHEGNSRWTDLPWGIVFGSYQFASTIWNNVPHGHTGGTPQIFIEGNKMYIFFSVTQATDSYQMVGTSIDLDDNILGMLPVNISVQQLTGTAPDLNAASGINSEITLAGDTVINLANLRTGMSGNITVHNPATAYKIGFTGAPSIIINQNLNPVAGEITMSGSSKTDCLSWYYDGTTLLINGTLDYL